jgi:glycosyltransferase involved in cell wall biosynthesis
VEPGDIEQLRGRLRLLLGDPAHARRLGAAARDCIIERFTWHACAQRCRDAYRSMIS